MFVFDITNLVEGLIFIVALLIFLVIHLIIININNWKNKKRKTRMEKNRKITIEIINEFENILAENNIRIPDKDRKENEDEACIYGKTYFDLEDSILEILNNENNL